MARIRNEFLGPNNIMLDLPEYDGKAIAALEICLSNHQAIICWLKALQRLLPTFHITPDVEVKLLPVPSNGGSLSQLSRKKSRDNFIWNEFQ